MTQRSASFEYLIIIYNLIEAYIAIVFAIIAGSIGLLAFGIESMAEAALGLILIVRYNMDGAGLKEEDTARRNRITKRWAGFIFFIPGTFLLFEPIRRWIFHDLPKPTLAGLIIALISMMITPLFTALRFKSSADGPTPAQNLRGVVFYILLPFMLLVGLGLNFYFGYWQADLISAMIIALFLFKRGYDINT